jgi:HK97 family phage major capsid protein
MVTTATLLQAEKRGRIETKEHFLEHLIEKRALQADADVAGGYILAGAMLGELVEVEGQESAMRRIGRVLDPIDVDELPVPTLENQLNDGEWVSELGTGTDDTTAPFGNRTLRPHPMLKRIKVSRRLLRMGGSNAVDIVNRLLASIVASSQEKKFIQGLGAGEPYGLLNTPGLPVYTAVFSGVIDMDDIRNWVFRLPARFMKNARILTSTDFIRKVFGIVDDDGQPVFGEFKGKLHNVTVEFTDGMPAIVDPVTDALVAGEFAAVIGDFSNYWIVDGKDTTQIQRLEELYTETNEVGFVIRQETDGLAVNANAFYALKIKA